MRRFAAVVLAALAVLSAACGDEIDTGVDPGDIGPVSRAEVFTGTLAPRESSFYAISTGFAGTIAITFASARVTTTNTTLSPTMTIGFGVPRGTDCQTSQTVNVTPGLQSHIRTSIDPGTFCVRIADTGGLSQTIDFAVRIVLPIDPTFPSPPPQNETFNSLLAAGGSSARSFVVPATGSYSITLTGSPVPVGLSIGIPEFGSFGCLPMGTVTASPNTGAQFTGGIDPGTYCVRVFDVGGITSSVSFSIAIVHP